MTQPDGQPRTHPGHATVTSGQDQDKESVETVQKRLEGDLRILVTCGKDLSRDHCRKLKVLTELENVLRVADVYSIDAHVDPYSPIVIRSAVRAAIGRLAESEGQGAIGYAQTRRLLFGLTEESGRLGSPSRWQAALNFYNEHVNFRSRPCGSANFHKHVYKKELLAPVVECLLKWESERDAPAHSYAGAVLLSSVEIARSWQEHYWRLFRIQNHLNRASDQIIAILDGPQESEALRLLVDEEPVRSYPEYRPFHTKIPPRDGSRAMRDVLFDIIVARRLTSVIWPSSHIYMSRVTRLVNYEISQFLDESFTFGEHEQRWLDRTLDKIADNLPKQQDPYMSGPDQFSDIMNESAPQGRTIFTAFVRLFDEHAGADCKYSDPDYRGLPDLRQPIGLRDSRTCSLHQLAVYSYLLRHLLGRDWIRQGREWGAMIGQDGSIPRHTVRSRPPISSAVPQPAGEVND